MNDRAERGLAQRDPLLAELDAMAADMDRFLGRRAASSGAKGWLPPVDVWETDDDVVIEVDVPGVSPDALVAEVVNGQLVVTGEREPTQGSVRRYRTRALAGTLRQKLHRAERHRPREHRRRLPRRRAGP